MFAPLVGIVGALVEVAVVVDEGALVAEIVAEADVDATLDIEAEVLWLLCVARVPTRAPMRVPAMMEIARTRRREKTRGERPHILLLLGGLDFSPPCKSVTSSRVFRGSADAVDVCTGIIPSSFGFQEGW